MWGVIRFERIIRILLSQEKKERSEKKNVFVEKYDEIRSFDGTAVHRILKFLI
jgi:hypothetical protein